MIVVIDYDTGNTNSIQRALEKVGLPSKISSDIQEIRAASGLILPGVGAFPKAMEKLKQFGLVEELKQAAAKGQPILGICLGMQLLLEGSEEHIYTDGLGLLPGICKKIPDKPHFPVPHVGWNQLAIKKQTPLTKTAAEEYVYFVHSFYADTENEHIDATCSYSVEIPSMISKENVMGIQFHPEKSGEAGLAILKEFKEVVEHADFSGN